MTGSLIFATQELREAGSLAKASTPEPFSTSKTSNWVARRGGLPPYVQHIAHRLMADPKHPRTESQAIELAVGIVENPPDSWGPEAKAAAAKAAAEWRAKRGVSKPGSAAKSAAKSVAEAELREGFGGGCTVPSVSDVADILFEDVDTSALNMPSSRHRDGQFSNLSKRVTGRGKPFATMMDDLKERGHVKNVPGKGAPEVTVGTSPDSGGIGGWMYGTMPDTFATSVAFGGLGEAALDAKTRDALSDSDFAIPGKREYPIHDKAHAANALARASGKPEEAAVEAAVYKRYPELRPGKVKESIDWDNVISEGRAAIAERDRSARREADELREATVSELRDRLLREDIGALEEATGDRIRRPERIIPGVISRKGTVGDARAKREGLAGSFGGYVHAVRQDGHREHIIGSTMKHRGLWKARTPKGRMMTFARHPDAVKALHEVHKGAGPLQLRETQAPPRVPPLPKISEADVDALLQEASLTAKLRKLRPGQDTKLGTYRVKGKVGGGYKLSHERPGEKAEELGEHGTISSVTKRIGSHRKLHEALVELEELLEGEGPRDYGEDAWSGALPRAKSLNQGETMRFPDGTALKRHASADGRDQWSAGTPSTWREDGVSWNSPHRTPERAVQSAMEGSAASVDPESLGGDTSFYRGMTVMAKGNGLRFAGVSPTTGNALVSDPASPTYRPSEVPWATLKPNSATTYQRQ